MKRKVLSMILATVMTVSVFAGCGSDAQEAPATTEAPAASEAPTAPAASADASADASVTDRTVFVNAEWVASVIAGEQAGYENAIVACVAYPWTTADYEGYGEGHIPTATYVSIMEAEDETGSEEGAYNLRSVEEIRDYAIAHGITADTPVILYGPDICGTARQAYAYIVAGVKNVKILDGGLDAWTAAGYDLATDEVEVAAAESFGDNAQAHMEYWVSTEDALNKLENDSNFKLVSIRSEEEWLGVTSGYGYMDYAGEPEGAVWGKGPLTSGDVAGMMHEDGTVMTYDELMAYWADRDFTVDNHLSFYCGTGWRACVPFLILYQACDDNISVFDGGWYQWLMNSDYPVQVGDPASADCVHTTVAELEGGKATEE